MSVLLVLLLGTLLGTLLGVLLPPMLPALILAMILFRSFSVRELNQLPSPFLVKYLQITGHVSSIESDILRMILISSGIEPLRHW